MARYALRLSVQYAASDPVPAPARAQVRRWVAAALDALPAAPRRTKASAASLSSPAPLPPTAALTVRFVDEDEARTLNRTFRGKDYATNVLTFPYDDTRPGGPVEADLVICMPVLAREAADQGKTLADHTAHLIVHGTLHACGLDHEDGGDAAAMERLERDVLTRFRIADPYRDDVPEGAS